MADDPASQLHPDPPPTAEEIAAAGRLNIRPELVLPISDEDEASLAPGPMTPEKLRQVAAWLDLYDRMAKDYLQMVEHLGLTPVDADLPGALRAVDSTEVQDELRRWADDGLLQQNRRLRSEVAGRKKHLHVLADLLAEAYSERDRARNTYRELKQQTADEHMRRIAAEEALTAVKAYEEEADRG